MNKKLAEFCTSKGMAVNGMQAYGVINEYEVNVKELNVNQASNSGEYPYQFHFSFYATDDQKRIMNNALDDAKIKRCQFHFTEYGLYVALTDFTLGKLIERLPSLFELFISTISNNGGLTRQYCPMCGKEFCDNKQELKLDGFSIGIDSDCKDSINAAIEAENKAFEEAPNNYLKGVCGALVGGVIGIVVAIILFNMGFYSSIAAIVSIVVGTLLYKKFGGKPTKMMIVIVSMVTLVFMAISVFLCYFIDAGIAAKEVGLDISAFEAFKIIMDDEEIAGMFRVDMIMVLLFSIIGVVLESVYISKSLKRKQKI